MNNICCIAIAQCYVLCYKKCNERECRNGIAQRCLAELLRYSISAFIAFQASDFWLGTFTVLYGDIFWSLCITWNSISAWDTISPSVCCLIFALLLSNNTCYVTIQFGHNVFFVVFAFSRLRRVWTTHDDLKLMKKLEIF